ncbi:hypothetical protein LAZ40_01490 [Cereibacter sphaeroides]|uniref:8-oxoguanine DNA glycosylase n=1 Tax=Cereibacter sphaeroides TaxID=1063 RepID=UPI001F38D6AB|nr:hypothetical protein [Cereibacter sphaeroides]MCE6957733.1 hypothetical protein [Cereibacter sphaeroides]MCE6971519.1 hypothetical protein [Cereibacter sphaeroides]
MTFMERNQDTEVVPGVLWGRPEWIPSPAFWAALASQATEASHGFVNPSATLHEEVGFCLLGGYGVTAEMNLAFFEVLRDAGVFVPEAGSPAHQIEKMLNTPANVDGKMRRFRFPRQKATRLEVALTRLDVLRPPLRDPLALRSVLLDIPGIGPKTASWIVRNLLGSDEVAILDIHVVRAGKIMGLFSERDRLPRDYSSMEKRFLDFCKAIEVKASLLDAIIWGEMRKMRHTCDA